jgi:hypothetical protein
MFTIELQQTKKKHVKQKKHSFLLGLSDAYNLNRKFSWTLDNFFLDLGIKQKTVVLKYCTCVILFWSKQMTTSCSQILVCFSNKHDNFDSESGWLSGRKLELWNAPSQSLSLTDWVTIFFFPHQSQIMKVLFCFVLFCFPLLLTIIHSLWCPWSWQSCCALIFCVQKLRVGGVFEFLTRNKYVHLKYFFSQFLTWR